MLEVRPIRAVLASVLSATLLLLAACHKPMTPRLIMLPGLAADARLFGPQRAAFEPFEVPPWLPVRKDDSLADYARRMAESFDTTEPFILVGVSLGGMLAQEIARHSNPVCVILVSSCDDGDQVPRYFHWFEALTRPIPDRVLGTGRVLAPFISRYFSGATAEHAELTAAMVRSTPIEFIRWGAHAIFEWRGAGELSCPVYHIHGDADRLIPPENVTADRIVEGGGHLINVTHPDQVNAFIAECIERATKRE